MTGVKIENSISDWQILQQENGYAKLHLEGSYERRTDLVERRAETPKIYAMVSREDTCEPVIWWTECEIKGERWSVELNLPAGGPYTVHTSMTEIEGENWSEWGTRGDIIEHIGVGDIYVIAGQSNSSGYGKDFVYDPPELGVHIYKNSKRWTLASHPLQDSTGADNNPNRDSSNTGHSMYLSFAKYLKRDLGYPIGLIQTSQGGSALDSWVPGGYLYQNMIERIKECGGKIKGVIWYQGCSETGKIENAESYCERFMVMRERLLRELGRDSIPFIIFQLAFCNDGDFTYENNRLWGTVREQLRRLRCEEKDMYVIPASDSTYSDFIHVSASSNMRLGERAAKTVLTHLFGKNYMCDAPDISGAKWIDDEWVELSFDNVYERLEARTEPFNLAIKGEDSKGIVGVSECKVQNGNKIVLKFERKLENDGVLHCGYTKKMGDFIPFDFATHLPVLSFYGVKIK